MVEYYNYLFVGAIIVLGILIIPAIIKSIIGPTVAGRIVAVNMISTMIVMILCILTVYFTEESYLADISMLYVLISFVAVVVLAKVYINVNLRKKFRNKKEENK